MVLVGSGWTMSIVLDLSTDSLAVFPIHWVTTTVDTVKMLESDVLEHVQLVTMEPSDFKEALAPKDVWRSALPMFGAQCVTIFGNLLTPEWRAGSWDSQPLVSTRNAFFCVYWDKCGMHQCKTLQYQRDQ